MMRMYARVYILHMFDNILFMDLSECMLHYSIYSC